MSGLRIRDQMISRSWFLLDPGGTIVWPRVYRKVGLLVRSLAVSNGGKFSPFWVDPKTSSMFSVSEIAPQRLFEVPAGR